MRVVDRGMIGCQKTETSRRCEKKEGEDEVIRGGDTWIPVVKMILNRPLTKQKPDGRNKMRECLWRYSRLAKETRDEHDTSR